MKPGSKCHGWCPPGSAARCQDSASARLENGYTYRYGNTGGTVVVVEVEVEVEVEDEVEDEDEDEEILRRVVVVVAVDLGAEPHAAMRTNAAVSVAVLVSFREHMPYLRAGSPGSPQ
jgi:hypothetical protein